MVRNVKIVFLCIVAILRCTIADDQSLKYGADYILDGLKKEIKPCDDSYNFFCGKWLDKVPVTNETDYLYEYNRFTNTTDKILLEAIKAIDINDKQTPTFKIWLKTFFDQCMNTKAEPEQIFRQIFNGIQRVIGPPPVLTTDKTAYDTLIKRNVWHLLGQAQRKLGSGVFFTVSIDNLYSDCGDTSKPILTFKDLWYPENELNGSAVEEQIINVGALFNIQIADDDKLKKLVDNMVKLNDDVNSFINESTNTEDGSNYDTVTVNSTSQLRDINPNIDWQEYFNGLFSKDQLDYWDQTQAKIQVKNKKYFQQIDDLVKKYDIETVFNYIFYKAMFNQLMTTALAQMMSTGDHEADCISWARSIQHAASARTYFDYMKLDPMDINSDIYIIADNVFTIFKRMVANVSWLTTQEVAAIYKKVNSIQFTPPVPDWMASVDKVENLTIKFDSDKSLYDNSVNLAKRISVLELDRYITQTPAIDTISFSQPSMSMFKDISASFGYALLPIYHLNFPLAFKYGQIGVKVAESLLEEFILGPYELSYPPSPPSWLNESHTNKFTDLLKCADDQITSLDCADNPTKCTDRSTYWNYTMVALLRQIDGLKVAYQAFKLASKIKPDSQQLSNLQEYNADQLFFMSAGRSYCSSYLSDDEDIGGLNTRKTRLVKIFRNVPDFSTTFQCGSGPSSVSKPCGVWG